MTLGFKITIIPLISSSTYFTNLTLITVEKEKALSVVYSDKVEKKLPSKKALEVVIISKSNNG